MSHAIRVFRHDRLVDTYTGVMVYITRLCQPNNRVDKDILLNPKSSGP